MSYFSLYFLTSDVFFCIMVLLPTTTITVHKAEAVVQRCSLKKVFLETSQKPQENTWILRIFKNTFSYRSPLVATSNKTNLQEVQHELEDEREVTNWNVLKKSWLISPTANLKLKSLLTDKYNLQKRCFWRFKQTFSANVVSFILYFVDPIGIERIVKANPILSYVQILCNQEFDTCFLTVIFFLFFPLICFPTTAIILR